MLPDVEASFSPRTDKFDFGEDELLEDGRPSVTAHSESALSQRTISVMTRASVDTALSKKDDDDGHSDHQHNVRLRWYGPLVQISSWDAPQDREVEWSDVSYLRIMT